MMNCGTVLILYNAPSADSSAFLESEAGVLDEVKAVSEALTRMGVSCQEIELRNLRDLPAALMGNPAHVAVNLVEGFAGCPSDAFLVPAACRAFGVEVTGNDTPCLALSTDKWQTKALLSAVGLRCPAGIVVPVGREIPSSGLPPSLCIVKPGTTDASEGIDAHSIVESSSPMLRDLVRDIHDRLHQPAIVEEMVGQREINVSILQIGDSVRVLPPAEIDFSAFGPDRPRIVGYAAKWKKDSFEYSNTPRTFRSDLTESQRQLIRDMALSAWRALGCRDYIRVDFRLTEQGEPVILEMNANPDISPDGGFAAALNEAAISYGEFVRALIENAAARCASNNVPVARQQQPKPDVALGNNQCCSDACPHASGLNPPDADNRRYNFSGGVCNPATERSKSAKGGFVIRRATARDREVVLTLLNQPNFFRRDELLIAEEVFDDAAKGGEHSHYQSFVLEEQGEIAGWICYGPTPCTLGTFDIYWIVVAAGRQGRKLGRALMEFAEAGILKRDGRIAVVETSGRAAYVPTRKFYERLGYHESARVRDFYAPDDDKIISVKEL